MQALDTPTLWIALVLLLAGCVPGRAAPDGAPTADEPFGLVALDVGQSVFGSRGMRESLASGVAS